MEKNFFAKREEEIIEFWEKTAAFKKSIENRDENNQYVFYDGPPFATGLPHYGHIVASTMKDIVPRFWTMRGKRVERRWGWDCHGLPIENIVEKEMGLNSRKDIEALGVTKFNECCETKIGLYADEWQKTIRRLGRWVDMDNDYRTMDLDFMESVWWVFKNLYEKDLVYEGQKSMHICPRCETTLSNIEVSQGYQDIIDLSATAKFELIGDPGTYVLAWTTTPWTLPGNVALAIGADILYAKVKTPEGNYILAADLCSRVFGEAPYEVIKTLSARDLVGQKYRPLFDFFVDKEMTNKDNLYTIVEGDFVSIDDGTGVVHIAPAFGEDDLRLGREKNLPFIQHVGTDGRFVPEVTLWAGLEVKPREGAQETDKKIIDYLKERDLIFASEEYRHSYPHCWRCDSPLLNYTTSSWFVNVTTIKEKMLELARDIHWSPEHLKAGRFGQWLEGARDWSISRSRYWGNPIPIWRCDNCCRLQVVGSVAELRELSGVEVHDIHKHHVDERTWACSECAGTMRRIPQVFDCWFESGSMPYGQMHYPMENQKKFEANFPAEFIAEGVDQTRAWFYVLHVLSTALFGKPAYKHVVVNGIVLAEDGQKMSKKKKNYPDPMTVIDKYGADALRYYLATSPVMRAEDLCFTEKGVDEVYKKVVLITLNILNFYEMFRGDNVEKIKSDNILDRWIVAKLNALTKEVTERMEDYDLSRALKPIGDFINELSTWYVRRSRDRFKSDDEAERLAAVATLREVLEKLALLLAPFTPFIAEHLWLKLGNKSSVHLEDWPSFDESLIDVVLLSDMERTRAVVELGLAARDERKIKVRQPLSILYYQSKKMSSEMESIVAEELNVLAVEHRSDISHEEFLVIKENGELKVGLNYFIDDKLKLAGLVRETVRQVNNLRRNAKLTIQDQVTLYYETTGENLQKLFASDESVSELSRSVLAKSIVAGRQELPPEFTAEAEIDGETIWFGVEK